MHKKNMLIREKARDLGVYHWEIAEVLGISESLFCRLLRHELSKDDQTRIVSVIDEIANSREVIKHADFDQAGSRADRAFGV